MSERSPRLPALDALRALAIAWVVIRHLLSAGLLPWKLTLATLLWVGNAGVDLFFVLSGFLIGRIVYRELESTGSLNVTQFWRRRWLRTLPAYFASLAFIRLSDLVLDDTFEWDRLWTYLVFLQTYASRLTRFNWSWSLCVEEHFYLLLPLLVLALSRGVKRFSAATTLRCLAAAAVLFSVCYRLSLYLGAPHSAEAWAESYLTTHCRLDGLGIGLALATVPPFRAGKRLTGALITVALGLLGMLLVFRNHPASKVEGFFAFSVAFGLVVLGLLGNERAMQQEIPGAKALAALSYALYLVHPVAIRAIGRLVPQGPWELRTTLALSAALGGAWVLRRGIELPFLRLRDPSP